MSYAITCVARTGSVAITTVTTGSDLPQMGYALDLDTLRAIPIGLNDTITRGVAEGVRAVRLGGLPDNCYVVGTNPRSVAVAYGESIRVAFDVTCARAATVEITTLTTGPDSDPDGYTVRMERGFSTTQKAIAINDKLTLSTLGGLHSARLEDVAENCDVVGGPTRTVDHAAGTSIAVTFTVRCTPATELAFVRAGNISRVKSNGTGLVRLTNDGDDSDPAWSADGQRIAFARFTGQKDEWGLQRRDIYVMNADGSNLKQLTTGDDNYQPSWSPDGRQIVFVRYAERIGVDVFVTDANVSGAVPRNLTREVGWETNPAWSPDGRRIAFVSDRSAYDFTADVYVATPDGALVTQLTNSMGFGSSSGLFYQPAWSPNGNRFAVIFCRAAFETCDSSTLALMNADGSALTRLITASGFVKPTWSPDGRTIAYAYGSIRWIRADTSAEGVVVTDGHSPSWRPRVNAP